MGAGVVVASSIAAVSFAHPSAERMCQTGGARIEGQWSPQRAADLAMAWEATAVPHASESFAITRARLDAYADAWTHEYIEACEATHVRGAQSERRLDLRMDCMQQRLDHFGALIDELEQVDDDVLSRSVTAVGALPEVEHCRDPQIHEQVTLDPATRKRVRAVEQHLAQARAKESAGRYAAGLQVATSALEDLGDLEAPHLRARLLLRQGRLQSRQGDAERGASILRDALRTASLTADRRLVAQVWIDLLFLVGSTLEQTEQAEGLALGSEAAVLAAGNPDDLRGAYLHKLATLEATAGRVEDALAHHEQSITLTEQSGADPLVLATRHANYGNALIDAGRYADARLQHRRAFDLSSSVYGQEHPILAQDLNNLARASQKLGEYDDALDAFTRALAIAERTLGTEHSDYADALYNLAVFHYDRQEFDRARTMGERALAVWTRAWGEDHPRIAAAHVHLGNIDQALGRLDDALLHAKRAYAIYRARFGDDYPLLRVPLNNIANNHYEQGRYSEALEGFHEAIALTERTLGPDHPSLAFPLTGAAKSLLKMDRPAAAVDPGERALALRELKQPEPILIGISAFVAARARWDAHDDRERAVELARQAHRAWTESEGGERDERRHEVETWLRKRGLATTEDVPRGANPG
jgi:tetratricopeptide (TPR) repeat protein